MQDLPIGYFIKSINDRLKTKADSQLKIHDLTMTQGRVLGFIHSKNGQATQKEIAEHLQVAHPTVVGIVSRMEKNGFVSCRIDPVDRRSKIVCLTSKADIIGAELSATIEKNEAKMLTGLTEEDIGNLLKYLSTIYDNLENI